MDLVSECVIDIAGTGMNTNKFFDVIGTSYTNCDRERVSLNLESQLLSIHASAPELVSPIVAFVMQVAHLCGGVLLLLSQSPS